MRLNSSCIIQGIFFFCAAQILVSLSSNAMAAEEYSFDVEEFESKPFEWGGYGEIKFEHMDMDADSAFYRLNFYQNPRSAIDRYTGSLQLECSYKKGIWTFNGVFRTEAVQDNMGWSDSADAYEANLSLKPAPFVTADIGKKVFKWGKGYAWNPVGFIDRPKDPNNPEEALEGYYATGLDLIKSFNGSLKTVALTTVALPVWKNINEDFGEVNHVNFAAKLYTLYLDTDIDFVIFG